MNIQYEIWRPVVGYEGLYEVSNLGRVKSCERFVWNGYGCGHWHRYKEKIMAKKKHRKHYSVGLFKDGKGTFFQISHLVVKAFPEICGPWFEGCEVHHIDHNPSNNNASNLLVLSVAEHRKIHSESEVTSELKRNGRKNTKPVLQLKNGVPYFIWESIREAEKIGGFTYRSIQYCLNGEYTHHKGFQWKAL